jgi:hypothetical protein
MVGMATHKTPSTSRDRTKADRSLRTDKGQRRGTVLLSPEQRATERQHKHALEEEQLISKQANGMALIPSEESRLQLLQKLKRHYARFDRVRGTPATKGNIPLENTVLGRASVETTGISGAKDEGLVHEPQRTIRYAGIETAQRSERQLSPRQLSEFIAYAAAHAWDSNSGVRPSDHIKTQFAKWLALGLSRADIIAAQPNLAQAYATETSRYPARRVKGLIVRPHKLPPGAKPALSTRPVWQLTKKELEAKRALERAKKQRQRQRQKNPTLT